MTMSDQSLLSLAHTAEAALPEPFVQRIHRELGKDCANRILASAADDPPRAVRFNPLRAETDATRRTLEDAGVGFTMVPWCPEAALIEPGHLPIILEHPLWMSGAVHVQSLPSIAAAVALDPQPGERILDLCAAPGGKTSHIAARMGNSGEVVANDLSRGRMHRMQALLKKLNARATVVRRDGTRIGRREPDGYDRVLVDAPCSGEGRFNLADPTSISDWTVSKTRRLSSLQKSLLHSAIAAVRPGGVVLYSTCTYGRIENEAVIERAISRYGDGPTGIELEEIPGDITPMSGPMECDAAPGSMLRSIPDPLGHSASRAMAGFFLARLRRRTR